MTTYYRHTLRTCNSYCFPTSILAALTHLNVTLHGHCTSCFLSKECRQESNFITKFVAFFQYMIKICNKLVYLILSELGKRPLVSLPSSVSYSLLKSKKAAIKKDKNNEFSFFLSKFLDRVI